MLQSCWCDRDKLLTIFWSVFLPCLKVLSGKLMPAETKSVDELSTQLFKKNFLEAGGLKFVINVLQKDVLPASIDPFVRQDCYAVALSLARFLLCVARTQTVPVRQRSSGSQNERQVSPVCSCVCVCVVWSVFLSLSGFPHRLFSQDGVEDMEDQPIVVPQRQLGKTISVEEEVARLTIEVSTTHTHTHRHVGILSMARHVHPSP